MTDDGDDAPTSSGRDEVPTDAIRNEAEEIAERGDVVARYSETDDERILAFERAGSTAAVAQNLDGYAMLKVRTAPDGDELERYYGFDVALDHVAELLGVGPGDVPVPDAASDMGM